MDVQALSVNLRGQPWRPLSVGFRVGRRRARGRAQLACKPNPLSSQDLRTVCDKQNAFASLTAAMIVTNNVTAKAKPSRKSKFHTQSGCRAEFVEFDL